MSVRNYLFHRVSDDVDPLWPPMRISQFEKTIKYLRNRFAVILLEDLLKDPQTYYKEKKIITISFDDGYKDNFLFALPLLDKYNCSASFYVVTDCIDKNVPTWTYMVDGIFQKTTIGNVDLNKDFVPSEFKNLKWNCSSDGQKIGKVVKPWMKQLPNRKRLWVMDQLFRVGVNQIESNKMMNWSDLKELKNAGYYIGSHSHTHPLLAQLEDENEIAFELEKSSDRIFEELGHRPETISYPIGSWDQRVISLSKKAGYNFGLAVEQRFYRPEKDDRMIIPRLELYNENWAKTLLRITGIYQKMRKLVK